MPLGAKELERAGRAGRRALGRWIVFGDLAVLALLAALATIVLLNSRAAY